MTKTFSVAYQMQNKWIWAHRNFAEEMSLSPLSQNRDVVKREQKQKLYIPIYYECKKSIIKSN